MAEQALVTEFDSRKSNSFFKFIDKNILDMHIYRYALAQFVVNNLRTRYRRSVLGFLWTLLNPLLTMSVMTVVFSIVFKIEIRSFGIYLFSGLAPWSFINGSIVGGSMSMVFAEGFLKKVYLPKLLFPAIAVTTEMINFFFSILSLLIIGIVIGFPIGKTAVLLPVVIFITYLFCLGITILVSVTTVYFRDLFHILQVGFTALFYTVPIIYPMDLVPEKYQVLFNLNPFYHFINLFRKVIYGNLGLTTVDWAIPIGLAIVAMAIGLYALMKQNLDLVFRL